MPVKPIAIALIGSIASGKSTALKYFKALGAITLNADRIADECLATHPSHRLWLTEAIGPLILNSDQTLNKPYLREALLHDADFKSALEQRIHPDVYQSIHTLIQQPTSTYYVCEISAFKTLPTQGKFNRICIIKSAEPDQIKRALTRQTWTQSQLNQLIQQHSKDLNSIGKIDDTLLNTTTLTSLHKQVERLHLKYLEMRLNRPPIA